ncbi:MAG TPA: cytochrome c biogenesis protein CcsA [Terriglobia bacterium]|nr:cytochrome c biogenesis protein CcsA [Terriglobia bacterium]
MRSKILGILSLVLMIANLYMIFIFAPNESTMGVIQRIFYFHLPAGIFSYVSAYLLGLGSIMFLIKRDLKWDRFAAASGEMGVLCTSLSIMSGALWAKPVWGIWWTWDARLTLQFLLALIFLSYLMLRAYLPEREKRAALGGVFGVLAMIDVPFNYLSIRWWRTQHPQPVILGGGLDWDMWKVMIVSFLAFAALYSYLIGRRMAIARVEEEVEYLEHAILAHD